MKKLKIAKTKSAAVKTKIDGIDLTFNGNIDKGLANNTAFASNITIPVKNHLSQYGFKLKGITLDF